MRYDPVVKPIEIMRMLGDVSTSSELSQIYGIPVRTIQHAASRGAFICRRSGSTVLISVDSFKVWVSTRKDTE
jgi:hypothetical protein